MADTIERALKSVLDQIDDRFEVVVVDDGSTDDSVAKLMALGRAYRSLRIISLERDRSRKLGITRNISIEAAIGEHILLHIDTDDVWEPYLTDFVEIYEQIRSAYGAPIFLSGQQLNMGSRVFLLKRGPYQNIYRGEDRDLWIRLANEGLLVPLLHRPFRTRLRRSTRIQIRKSARDLWYHMLYDLRSNKQSLGYVRDWIIQVVRPPPNISLSHRLLRLLLIVPALIASRFAEPLATGEVVRTPHEFARYVAERRGTYEEILARLGYEADVSFMSDDALRVFREKPAENEVTK